ncbi:hypothetical protein B0H16DRAFT_1703528 [Mycena metata]|uniref:Deoxyribonuclease NucA/NucB domain-containing protein n=1 Tax=Mycena metata TaxID=1033252 RepID=A0AAD7H3Z4_9AGAR|nr:hypothetical protein B0H16DRAFT_1703528 [Mycena metata]
MPSKLRILSVAAVALSVTETILAQVIVTPSFDLVCGDYPDVCDNHCNAFYCHDITSRIHYDATSDVGTATQRRTAIGCGSGNYCPSGTDCDEFPYASTYDGGLGCFPDGYDGGDQLVQIGTTLLRTHVRSLCTTNTSHSLLLEGHGNALGQFYTSAGLNNGDPFAVFACYSFSVRPQFDSLVSIDATVNDSPLCKAIDNGGFPDLTQCPDESSGDYRSRSTPATPICPARDSARRGLSRWMRFERNISDRPPRIVTATTSSNRTMRYFLRGEEEGPVVGGPVWTADANGNTIRSTIVKFSLHLSAEIEIFIEVHNLLRICVRGKVCA